MRSKFKSKVSLLIFIAIMINGPFLIMALHTDEWGYLLMGKRILENPVDPFHGFEKYEGEYVELKKSSTFAPLIPYYFAFILWTTGSDSEIVIRMFFIIFTIICILSIYSIANRFLNKPFGVTLSIVFSPAFFLLSHLATTDISGLAFSLLGLALFINGIERSRNRRVVFAGLSLGLSILIRYQNLYMLPLLFVYSYLFKRGYKKAFIIVLIVILVLLPWFIQNLYFYGNLHILTAGKAWKGGDITYNPFNFLETAPQKIISSMTVLGSSFLFFPCILFIYISRFRQMKLVSKIIQPILLILILVFLFKIDGYNGVAKLQLILFVVSGILFTLFMVYGFVLFIFRCRFKLNPKHADFDYVNGFIFTFFWFFFWELLLIIFLPFNSVRYTLPQLVPGLIFFFKYVEDKFQRAMYKKFLTVCLILTFINGALVAYGDYILADVYRNFARVKLLELNQSMKKETYFIGEEGFRGYMEDVGAEYLLKNDNSPGVGSLVVIPTFLHQYPINNKLMARLKLKEKVVYKSRFPIRIINPRAKTSFFCNYAGLLPYSISNEPIEEFKVYAVYR